MSDTMHIVPVESSEARKDLIAEIERLFVAKHDGEKARRKLHRRYDLACNALRSIMRSDDATEAIKSLAAKGLGRHKA
jgi:hypothetical protein